MPSMKAQNLSNETVIVLGEDGNIKIAKPLSELQPQLALDIQIARYGRSLLDILIEGSRISYISGYLRLKQILTDNPHSDATNMIGNIAEALVVKYCNENPEVNRTLAMYARGGQKRLEKYDEYVAIATNSTLARDQFRQHFSPNDTQRDVIWVDKNDSEQQLSCIKQSSMSTKPAGLQVKASHDGIKYILPSIIDYYYPILYFDLSDDWGAVYKRLIEQGRSATLINPDEIGRQIKNDLQAYYDIVIRLIRGETTINYLIEKSKNEGDSVLSAGIYLSGTNDSKTILLPSHIRRT